MQEFISHLQIQSACRNVSVIMRVCETKTHREDTHRHRCPSSDGCGVCPQVGRVYTLGWEPVSVAVFECRLVQVACMAVLSIAGLHPTGL